MCTFCTYLLRRMLRKIINIWVNGISAEFIGYRQRNVSDTMIHRLKDMNTAAEDPKKGTHLFALNGSLSLNGLGTFVSIKI